MKYAFYFLFSIFASGAFGQIPAQTLPDFEFSRFDQTLFTNLDLPKDKMLFFVFFDSDCEHCQLAVKNIDQQYGFIKKAAVYLISLDDQDKIKHFMAANGPHLLGRGNVRLLQDKRNQFITKFKPKRYPAMFLYSAEKKLIDYEDNEETVFRIVNSIRKGKQE